MPLVKPTPPAACAAAFSNGLPEFLSGGLVTAGYLGSASSTAQGAEQSGSWLQGVWRRDFENGIALVNPSNNGSQIGRAHV